MNALRRPAAIFLVAALLDACAGAPTATPSSATPAPAPSSALQASVTPEPSASVTPEPSAPAAPEWLEVDGLARIVTDYLVVRSAPGTGSDSIVYPTRMPNGYFIYILDGPIAADGYNWYHVIPIPPYFTDDLSGHPEIGWLAAAGRDGEPWVAPWTGTCPEPTLSGLRGVWRPVALACLGGVTLTLDGEFLGCDPSVDQGGPVDWLQSGGCFIRPVGDQSELPGPLTVQVAGPTPTIPVGTSVRMTVHMDDPASADCVPYTASAPEPPMVLVRFGCRSALVMTEIQVLAG